VLRICTAPEDLARLYPWLDDEARVLNLPDPMLYGMHVALEEAVMNVVMHASDPGEISVELRRLEDAAELVVEDGGPAFDLTEVVTSERKPSLADARPGGMGLNLMRHYCKDISYERVGERNRLTLRFPSL
jgi:serine/threonine-protein kinase RsbW